MTIGRNAPCPCGSGKKYKHCCIAGDRTAYTARDRQAAQGAIGSFLAIPALEAERDAALDALQGDIVDSLPEPLHAAVFNDPRVDDAVATFMCFDAVFSDGRTCIRHFLDGPGSRLVAGQRAYLERIDGSAMSLYEVVAVRSDSMTLSDVLDGHAVEVQERLWTADLEPSYLLGVRVITGPSGAFVCEPPLYVFLPEERKRVTGDLRGERRRLNRSRSEFEVAFRERLQREMAAIVLHRCWLDHIIDEHRDGGILVDGVPLLFARVTFEVLAPEHIAGALDADHRLKRSGEAAWTWLEKRGRPARVLAEIRLEGNHLIAQTFSNQHGAEVRFLIQDRLGDAVRYLGTDVTDPMEALREGERTPARTSDDASGPRDPELEELARLLGDRRSFHRILNLSMLDGFLCAVASSPSAIPSNEWLPDALGIAQPSLFETAIVDARLQTLVRRHADKVAAGLAADNYEPIVAKKRPAGLASRASLWCMGFVVGIGLRNDDWKQLFEDDAYNVVALTVLLFAKPVDRSETQPNADQRRFFERDLRFFAQTIYRYWRERPAEAKRRPVAASERPRDPRLPSQVRGDH
jgi:yecA family protein